MNGDTLSKTLVATVTFPGEIATAFAINQDNKDLFIGRFFPGTSKEYIAFGDKPGEKGTRVNTARELFDALFSYGKTLRNDIESLDVENSVENVASASK